MDIHGGKLFVVIALLLSGFALAWMNVTANDCGTDEETCLAECDDFVTGDRLLGVLFSVVFWAAGTYIFSNSVQSDEVDEYSWSSPWGLLFLSLGACFAGSLTSGCGDGDALKGNAGKSCYDDTCKETDDVAKIFFVGLLCIITLYSWALGKKHAGVRRVATALPVVDATEPTPSMSSSEPLQPMRVLVRTTP